MAGAPHSRNPLAGDSLESVGRAPPDIGKAAHLHPYRRSPLAGDAFEAVGRAPPDIGKAAHLHPYRRSPLAGDAFEAVGRAPPDIGKAAHLHPYRRSLLASDAFEALKPKSKPKLEDQDQELSSSYGGRVTFSLRGHACAGCACEQRSWPEGRRAGDGIHAIAMPATLRAFLRPPAASEGPRVEPRAIVARTFRTSQSPAPVGARLRAMLSKLQSQSQNQNRLHSWACLRRGVGMLRQREGVVTGAPP